MNSTKKILSVILALLMVVTAVPYAVFAVDPTIGGETSEGETPCTHEGTIVTNIETYPTCTTNGTGNNFCTKCQTVVSQSVLGKLSHSYTGESKSNGDGTHSFKCLNGCNEYGGTANCEGGTAYCTKKAVCTVCKGEYGELNVGNHKSLTPVPAKAATCTEDGYTAYQICEDCRVITGKDPVTKTGHKFEGAYKSNEDGTHSQKCVNPGCEVYGNPTKCSGGIATCTVKAICQFCREEYGERNSENHTSLENVVEVKATCQQAGHNAYRHCAACKTDIGKVVYDQLPHSFSDVNNCINNGNSTHSFKCVNGCNKYGLGTLPYEQGGFGVCSGGTATCVFKAVCSACKKEYGEINPNSHPDNRIEYVPGKGASCNEPGYTTFKHCLDCGKDIGKSDIAQLDHRFTGVSRSNENGTHSFRCVYGCGTYGGDANCVDTNKDCICDVCGYKIPHVFTNYVYDEGSATCLDDGTKTAKCDNCQKATDTVVDEGSHTRAEHVYTNFVSNGDALCTVDGTKSAVCDICRGYPTTVEDKGSALGHAYNHYLLDEGSATCLENGTETSKCDRCDVTDTHEAKGSALGHSFTIYVYNDDAECLKDGTETAICDRCSETDTRTAPNTALTHVESDILGYPAGFDCTIGGLAYIKCLRCDAEIGETVVAAAEHIIVDDPEVAPSCNEAGKTAGSHCVICGMVIVAQESIEKLDHAFSEWETVVPATCLDGGKEAKTCTVCGETQERSTEALGHDFSTKWTVDVKATCLAEGSKSHHCTRCSAKTDVTKTSKSDHTYIDVVVTAATTSKAGKSSKKCSVCGSTTSASKVAKIETIKISKTAYSYDGTVKSPTVTVKDANGKKLKAGTDYTIKYSKGRKNVGLYAVKVTFTGKYSGSKKIYFKINPQDVGKVTAKAGSKQATLSWAKAAGAQKYIIYYSTEKNGSYKKLGTKETTSATVKQLASGKTYYFKVKAFKTVDGVNYYASASSAVAVTVK